MKASAVVALDFDGVLCDSIDECMLVAHNAYWESRGRQNRAVMEIAELDPDLVKRFRRLRHLVRPAGEYLVLMHYLFTSKAETKIDQAGFDALTAAEGTALATYQALFFETRNRWRTQDPDEWTALHRLFPQARCVALLQECFPVHLVTTKDRESVVRLNRARSLGLDESRLWTAESKLPKASSIQRIAAAEEICCSQIHFVDDHPDHLRDVRGTGARCYWARWGYTPRLDPVRDASVTPLSDLSELIMFLDETK